MRALFSFLNVIWIIGLASLGSPSPAHAAIQGAADPEHKILRAQYSLSARLFDEVTDNVFEGRPTERMIRKILRLCIDSQPDRLRHLALWLDQNSAMSRTARAQMILGSPGRIVLKLDQLLDIHLLQHQGTDAVLVEFETQEPRTNLPAIDEVNLKAELLRGVVKKPVEFSIEQQIRNLAKQPVEQQIRELQNYLLGRVNRNHIGQANPDTYLADVYTEFEKRFKAIREAMVAGIDAGYFGEDEIASLIGTIDAEIMQTEWKIRYTAKRSIHGKTAEGASLLKRALGNPNRAIQREELSTHDRYFGLGKERGLLICMKRVLGE